MLLIKIACRVNGVFIQSEFQVILSYLIFFKKSGYRRKIDVDAGDCWLHYQTHCTFHQVFIQHLMIPLCSVRDGFQQHLVKGMELKIE